MPKKRTLTGRTERSRRKNLEHMRRTKNNRIVNEFLNLDTDNVCRFCLQSTTALLPLFKEHSSTVPSMVDIISQLTNCNVRQEDGFPQFICNSCKFKAHNAFNFKKQCEAAQHRLIDHFANTERSIKTEDLVNSEPETIVNSEVLEKDQVFRIEYMQEDELIVKRENTSDNESETDELNLALSMHDKDRGVCDAEGTGEVLSLRNTLLEGQLKSEGLTSDLYHHNYQKKLLSLKCDECNQVFSRTSDLETHIVSVHNAEKHYTSQDVKSKDTSAISKTRKKPRKPVMRVKCKECNKGFASRLSLMCHRRLHTGERPYVCLDCGKGYARSEGLRVHLRLHTGERPFICKLCNKAFAHSSSYYEHKRVHNGEKPFTCSDCNKTFARLQGLQTHRRSHTGEKPYKCGVCNKAFAYVSSFNTHKRLHTGEKPYKCQDCNEAFVHYPSLKAHKKLHIKAEPAKLKD